MLNAITAKGNCIDTCLSIHFVLLHISLTYIEMKQMVLFVRSKQYVYCVSILVIVQKKDLE